MTVRTLISKMKNSLSADEFINDTKQEQPNEEVKVTIRIPRSLLTQVDTLIKDKMAKESRNSWILRSVIHLLDIDKTPT